MERGSCLVLAAAAVTVFVLLAQVAMINAMSGVYLERDGSLQEAAVAGEEATELVEGRGAVFEPLAALPVVLMHGMGDAAGNSGMLRIQKVRGPLFFLCRLVHACDCWC